MLRNIIVRLGLTPLILLVMAVVNAGADVLNFDFDSQPAGTRILDSTPGARPDPRVEGGVLKLTDANDPGANAGFAIGPFPTTTIQAMQASWKSRLGGGGGGGADGYSFNIGTDLSDTFPQGEEGTGTGLSVNIDTFDNGVALDPAGTGIEIKWAGNIIASTHINKDNAGDGIYLRKDTFVDAAVSVSPSGFVVFVYDGITVSAQIPAFAGLEANQYMFTARTGGANDNQWIDDLRIVTQTPDVRLITPEGSTWSFNDATVTPGLDGTGWQNPSFDTSTDPNWRLGTALFGNDGTGPYDGVTQPFTGRGTNGFETELNRTGGRVTFYFRKNFTWSGPTAGVTLVASNWVDDGQVVFLNGTEVSRIRIADGPYTWDTLGSNPGTEGLVEVTTWNASSLVEGENTVAVEVHQSSTGSSDVAFALGLTAKAPIPPTIVNLAQPTNTTVFANRPVTFNVEAIGSPAVTYQWFKDGSPIDPLANASAATSSLVIPNASVADEGSYFARVSSVLGSVDGRTATLTVLPAVPLKVVRAFGSLNLQAVTIVFDQFVDPTSATDLFNYAVDGGFGITAATLNPDGLSVTLTLDSAQSPNQNYCVTVAGVTSGAGLDLDPNPTTVCYQSFVVSPGFAVQEIYFTGAGVLLSDLEASPLYPNNPSQVRYRSFAGINTADEFDNYGTRLSGWIVPPVSGDYVFYLAADDQGDLWLSTDSSPANLVKIADEPIWSGRRTWTGAAGGGGRDGASVSGGPQQNISGPIPLVAGQMYYFQARMKEGGGGDNLDIAWQIPGDPVPLNGSSSIPGAYLASLADPANASLAINTQPQDQRIVLNPAGSGAQTLLAQDFNSGDGGFTAETPQDFPGSWAYNAAAGSWQVNQDNPEEGHPMTSRLRTGQLTVTRDGAVQLSFNHRYSFELSGGNWDGGQVRMSLNGGAFTVVPGSAFTAGGYNGTVIAGNSAISTQAGFVQNSPGHQTPAFITSTANLGFFLSGDVIQIEFLYAGDTNTRGEFVPSWEINELTLTQGIAAQQPARFTVAMSGNVGGNASPAISYQWERNCGAGWALIPGATSPVLTFDVRLADNGCRFRVRGFVPGANVTSAEAVLTVVQPNTPPSFACGPTPAPVECGAGSVTIANWATDILPHSITRVGTTFSSDFSSGLPAGTRIVDPNAADGVVPRIEDGVLKLSNGENLGVGGLGGFGIGPFPLQTFDTIEMTWKSLVGGGGGGGADGYSINIGNDLVDNFTAEEGTGTGISVTVDTFDNGTGLDVGVDFKWKGNRVAYIPIPKDDDGSGRFLRKDTFVDASLSVAPSGSVVLTYDGNTTTVNLPGFTGVPANQVILLAREGGANDRHWIDDLNITAFPPDASSAEAGQTVQFLVTNDNPALFSAQPAVSSAGTLTYTLAPGAIGTANVSVVAQDNGGTSDGGRDTSTACTFAVTVNDTVPPTIACPTDIAVRATGPSGAVATWTVSASDSCGSANVVCTPASGSTFAVGTATVTCVATDGGGNTASCSFRVIVNPPDDNRPPTAVISSEQLIDLTPEFENPVLISCNWWNACLVADGWTSSDPEGEDLTYLWFLEGEVTPIGAGPVITNCLEVGSHTIVLTVTDPKGLSDTASQTIEVVTAPLAIDLLIEQINESHKNGVVLSRKIKRELTETLRVALNHAGRERLRETQKALDAFEKKVRAQVAKTEPEAAAAWIRWSQAVSEGMEKCIKPPRKSKDHDDKK